jgi:hypothetical protein
MWFSIDDKGHGAAEAHHIDATSWLHLINALLLVESLPASDVGRPVS